MRPICAVRTAPTELTLKAGLCPRECRDHGTRNRESYPRVFRAPESMGRFAPLNRGVARDRVALGRCRPRAPTDPYVLALEHTVLQITGSLRAGKLNARCARWPAGNAGAGAGN